MATVFLETFGCQMNELDSELVRSQLRALGHTFVPEWRDADVVLFNTCSVREHAEHRAYSRLGMVGLRKNRGERVILGVLGCMAERDGTDMLRRYPQVDLLCGPGELDRLPLLIDNAFRSERAPTEERVALAGNRNRRTAALTAVEDNLELLDLSRAFDPDARDGRAWSAYVRITRGCNKFCTYCVVPHTRGAEVHRPPDHIVDECRRLVEAGVVEITLLGQTVNHYRYTHGTSLDDHGREAPQVGPGLAAFRNGGIGTGGLMGAAVNGSGGGGPRVTTFATLLARIHDEVPQLRRLRFVTSYPRDFGDDALDVLASCPRIAPYIHAPAQSGSDRVLKLMNRGYEVAEYRAFVERIFERVPQATLAGDFIVGFPTETEQDFEASLELIRSLPFKNNFIFKYSPRPGTVAIDRFTDDIPAEVKKVRNNRMLEVQVETSRRAHASWIDRDVEVLVERVGHGAVERPAASWALLKDDPLRRENAARHHHADADAAAAHGAGERGARVALAVIGAGGPRAQSPVRVNDHTALSTRADSRGSNPRQHAREQGDDIEVVGRTSGDLIVSARIPAHRAHGLAAGSFIRMRIQSAEPLLLRGAVIDAE